MFESPNASADEDRAGDSDSEDDSEPREEEVLARSLKSWQRAVMQIHAQISSHKSALLFHKPITDESQPGYSSAVRRPMDLTTIKTLVSSGRIRSTNDFEHAVMLMFSNALMYNREGSFVYEEALSMRSVAKEILETFKASTHPTKVARAPETDGPKRRGRRTGKAAAAPVAAQRPKRKRGGD